ncbi:unnamed protein product [Lota lota]
MVTRQANEVDHNLCASSPRITGNVTSRAPPPLHPTTLAANPTECDNDTLGLTTISQLCFRGTRNMEMDQIGTVEPVQSRK